MTNKRKRSNKYQREKDESNDQEEETDEDEDEDEVEIELDEDEAEQFAEILGLLARKKRKTDSEYQRPPAEQAYLDGLKKYDKEKLIETEKKIAKLNETSIPLKFQILNSDLEEKSKANIIEKIKHFELLPVGSGEYFKLKKYMNGLLRIPFKKFSHLPIKKKDKIEKKNNFIKKIKNDLDNCVYGQENAKNSILQIIGKWISNPGANNNVIGLYGPPGIGKTSMIKNGLAKSLNIPFGFITLGGSSNGSTLEGFDYTYEGAKWGRIVDILMENKCMNPILFFDELDKVSEDKGGNEIISILIHLTDSTQNNSFNDKYFNGIDFDLSRSFLIFSFNDINKINPILKDRMTVVEMEGFSPLDKINIATKFSLSKICDNIGIKRNKIDISGETIRVIISTYCKEKGIRKLEKCLETLIMKINLYHITKDITNLNLNGDSYFDNPPYKIEPFMAIKMLDPVYRKDDMNLAVSMMYC